MSKKIVAGVIIAIVALVVCLVPLKEVAYTITVDYQDIETYYEDEPYEVSHVIEEKVLFWPDLTTSRIKGEANGRIQTIGIRAEYANRHDFPLEASFVLLKTTDRKVWEGSEYYVEKGKFERLEARQFHVEPGGVVSEKFYFKQQEDEFWRVKIEPEPIYIEKEVTTTEHRQVGKQRTVTKQRPETHYKKMTLLDYLLHY